MVLSLPPGLSKVQNCPAIVVEGKVGVSNSVFLSPVSSPISEVFLKRFENEVVIPPLYSLISSIGTGT